MAYFPHAHIDFRSVFVLEMPSKDWDWFISIYTRKKCKVPAVQILFSLRQHVSQMPCGIHNKMVFFYALSATLRPIIFCDSCACCCGMASVIPRKSVISDCHNKAPSKHHKTPPTITEWYCNAFGTSHRDCSWDPWFPALWILKYFRL